MGGVRTGTDASRQLQPFGRFGRLRDPGSASIYDSRAAARDLMLAARSPQFSRRALAGSIDLAITLAIAVIVLAAVAGLTSFAPWRDGGAVSTSYLIFAGVVTFAIMAAYSTVLVAFSDGQTVGKRAMGLRVVENDGTPLSAGRAAVRELAVKRVLFGVLAVISLGTLEIANLLWPLIDPQRRSLHDMASGTRVLDADADATSLSIDATIDAAIHAAG